MMLCAVLRAIFRPAALVAEGCFRFEFVVPPADFGVVLEVDIGAAGGA
jgi:hypothetical protein